MRLDEPQTGRVLRYPMNSVDEVRGHERCDAFACVEANGKLELQSRAPLSLFLSLGTCTTERVTA
jgi:hypothetical protein